MSPNLPGRADEVISLVESSGLAGLLARVEVATGADREIEGLLEIATRKVEAYRVLPDPKTHAVWTPLNGHNGYVESQGCRYAAEGFTTSLDAALALVERVLPNDWPYAPKPLWLPTISQRFNGDWEARLYRADKGKRFDAVSKTAPLAIIASLLKALIAKEAADVG